MARRKSAPRKSSLARKALFAVIGYINGEVTEKGSAFGRNEAKILAEEMQGKKNSLTVGIYNRQTGNLVAVRKPKVCRSGKRF